jgi:VanZ family protein
LERRNRARIIRYLPALVWMGVIYALSSRSGGQLNEWLPWFRSLLPGLQSFDPMHYAAYFILALTVAYGLGARAFTWGGCFQILVICLLYGASDEWHQSYVPNRSPDLHDLRNDGIGAAAACLILLGYAAVVRPRRKRANGRNYSSR